LQLVELFVGCGNGIWVDSSILKPAVGRFEAFVAVFSSEARKPEPPEGSGYDLDQFNWPATRPL